MQLSEVSNESCAAQVKTKDNPTGEDKHKPTKHEPTDGDKDEPTGGDKRWPHKWKAKDEPTRL